MVLPCLLLPTTPLHALVTGRRELCARQTPSNYYYFYYYYYFYCYYYYYY